MRLIAYDIETAPLPDAVERIEKIYPFNPDKVKLGNASKPETVERIIEEARANYIPNLLDTAQLNPALSYICSFGMFCEDDGYRIWTAKNPESEADCLLAFGAMVRSTLGQGCRFMGWNSDRFDTPYILKRSWISGFPVNPALFPSRGRGFAHQFVDLMKVWTCWQYGEYAKLTTVAKILDCVHPDRDESDSGKDFYKWLVEDPKKAESYAKADLYETFYIGKRLLEHEVANPLRSE